MTGLDRGCSLEVRSPRSSPRSPCTMATRRSLQRQVLASPSSPLRTCLSLCLSVCLRVFL
ncbi:hypothetical protein E2C01_085977 [Portunus trituberculatus]|uniref:Uncharacterized protein n=1 Tax=Portunus trituberculatus TaxID=210409 RepID=A0A5B7J823_PORTR|nr:hypothetical protein [Portunus trituberculatus]